MQFRNTRECYGLITQLLHWGIVALIVYQLVLVGLFEPLKDGVQKSDLIMTHKAVGFSILLLVLIRLVWRALNPVPELPETVTDDERTWSRISHIALYVLMLILPLSGWLMSSAAGYSINYFSLFEVPVLLPENETLEDIFHEVHEVLAGLLVLAVFIHFMAAMKHHFINKDGVLKRIVPFWK